MDWMTRIELAVCAVCLRESANFEQFMYDEALLQEEGPRLMKSFVYAEHENFCAHAACLGVSISEVVPRMVTVEEDRPMKIYILKSQTWKNHLKSGEECLVCSREGFLSATIRAVGEEEETRKAHLLCALNCNSLLLENTRDHTFRLVTDSNNSSAGECCYCSNEIGLEGWKCDHKECSKACHVYCHFFDRKEKQLSTRNDSNLQQGFQGEENSMSKGALKHWYRKPRAAKCELETEDFTVDIIYDDVVETECIQACHTSLKQIDITEKLIFDKVKQLAYPQKPDGAVGLGTLQETFCDSHSADLSSYCNCRDNKEKIEPEEIQSIFCEDCGVWFHKPCVGNPEVDSSLSWKCPKCNELNLAVLNFEGYVSELCDGSKPQELHKTGMLFRDHMILLRLIDSNKTELSVRNLLALQELMPFSIKGLVTEAAENQDRSVLFHNLLDEALTDILKSLLKNTIISVIDTDEKLRCLDKEAFAPLIKMCQNIKQVIKNIISTAEKDDQYSLKRLKYLKEEVVEKVAFTLTKFSQTNDRETLMVFLQITIETGLIKDTPAEERLTQLLDLIEITFDKLIEKYQAYQEKVINCRLLTRDIEDLRQYCIEETIMKENWYMELPPLIRFFVQQLVNTLRANSQKMYNRVSKFKEIRLAIKSNIQFLFFSFEDTAKELRLLIETERNVIEWERKVSKLESKLKEAKDLDDTSLLCSDRRSEILVSIEEFNSAFRCLHPSETKFVKEQPKFASLAEKESMAGDIEEDETMTFQDVMDDYVRECIPLSKLKLAIIEREAVRYKVDQLLNSTIMIKEADLLPLEQEFSKYVVGGEDKQRLAKLKQLRQDLDQILDPNYPANIDQRFRLENVKAQSQRLSRVFIEGPCKEKIKKLCKSINFISEIDDYLGSQGIYTNGQGKQKLSSTKEEPLKDVDWSKMDFLGKSLFFKDKFIPLFPDIEAYVHKLYSNYMVYLVEQASAHGEKTDVNTILLVETINMHVRDKPELNPIYVRRRESLIAMLRGAIQLHQASNLTVNNLKTQVEELLEKKRYLKGFSDDKCSKVNQAVSFLSQLETIAVMLRRVKVFRKEDVNIRNREMYQNIAEAMGGPNMRFLPLVESELNCTEVASFSEYFAGVNHLVSRWNKLKTVIDDIHCQLPKFILNNHLSHAILLIFDLPDLDVAKEICEGMSKYSFLEDTVQLLRKQIELTEVLEKHLDDSANVKIANESIDKFRSSSTRKELQMYIQFLLKNKLPQLWFMTQEIKDMLRFYWIYNKLSALLFDSISLRDLKVTYTAAINSEKCNDFVKNIIKENKMISTIDGRIEAAERLKESFLGCARLTPDKFFQLMTQIRNSTVQIFAPDEEPNSEGLDKYLAVMEVIGRNYSVTNSNLASKLSFEEYQQSIAGFPVPFKIEEFVKKQLREPIDSEKWLEKMMEEEYPYQVEIEFLATNRLHAESKACQQLEKAFSHTVSILNKVETEVEEVTMSNLFGSEDKIQSVKSILESINLIKYGCKGEQLKLFIKVLVWLLKETDLFDERDSLTTEEPFMSLEMFETLNYLCTSLKTIFATSLKPFVLEELIKTKSSRHSDLTSISHQEKSEFKELEELSTMVTPTISCICELYSRVMDAIIKVQHSSQDENHNLKDLLNKIGLPSSLINKINFDLLLQSKDIVPEENAIQNDLIDSPMPSLEFPRLSYQKWMDKNLELIASYQKTLKNKFDLLVAVVEPVRSRRQSMCSPIKELEGTPVDKKKLNSKVVEAKKAKNSSDQKENEIESRGKQLDSKSKKVHDFTSRKQSHASVNGHSKEEENGQLAPLYENGHKPEDKQLKKRKPEIVKEERKEAKADKKAVSVQQRQGPGPKMTMFESLTLKIRDKRLDNKKVSFVSVVHGLSEKVIDEIGLRGHIDLDMTAVKPKDQFENVKNLIKKEVPLIYGHLNCRSNDVSTMLDESLVWEGQNERVGRVWIFSSKLDIEFVKDYQFLPTASMLTSKSYYLFVLEKRVDGKDVDTSGGQSYPRKGRNASPEGRKSGHPIVDETKSVRESKSRSIKGERATKPRKNRHE